MKKPGKRGKDGRTGKKAAIDSARAERAAAVRALLDDLDDSPPPAHRPVDSGPKKRVAAAAGPKSVDRPASRPAPARKTGKSAAAVSKPVGRDPVKASPVPGPAAESRPVMVEHSPKVGAISFSPGHATLADKHRPRKHAPGALNFMDVVFYRNPATGEGERLFIESAPRDWTRTAWVRVTDKPLRPDREDWPTERRSFALHADLLELSPIQPRGQITLATNLPTEASVARAERAKTGQRDVGDVIAVRLRACKSLDDVYESASEYLNVPVSKLKEKYGKLNPGQQRMNLGNRMRNQFKKYGKGENE